MKKSISWMQIKPRLKEIREDIIKGVPDKLLYDKYNVSHDTWIRWKKNKHEFSELYTISEKIVTDLAVKALHKKMLGFEYEEVTTGIKETIDRFGEKRQLKNVNKTRKIFPPDIKALEFYLANKDGWTRTDKRDDDKSDEELYYDLDNLNITKAFKEWFFEEYNKPQYLFHVLKGGRASGKSTTVARQLIKDILKYPINILVVRKIKSTLLESCYEDLKQAINDLGVQDEFRCVGGKNFYIKRRRTNQRFIFRGGQEPERIKSIKTSKFPLARLWVEESTEFKTYEDLKTIFDSVVRAKLPEGIQYKVLITYNPPRRKNAWCNKKYSGNLIAKNTFVHHSTSFDNPYLSEEFLIEAEQMKKENTLRYEWNYLGKIGNDIVPFSNLKFRTITNEEIASFDNIVQGIDWGFSVDPVHFGRHHFDSTRRILYLFDEIHGVKISNNKLGTMIIKKGYNDVTITADSAEPKSINDMKSMGIRCVGAKKGAGSVEHGLEWLDSLNSIVIDPDRCPNAAREFDQIDYATDKNGDLIPRLEDKNNHSIDCCRYSLEYLMWSKRKYY